MKKECIFIVDPMCSWCWGFSPIIETLRDKKENNYTFSLVLGGLRTKGQMAWDKRSKNYLRGHWEQVSRKTGQEFRNDIFSKDFFEYDTYPACKAVVSVRELFGMEASFNYLHTIQQAFYTQSKDITKRTTLIELLDKRWDTIIFETFFESDRATLLMEHDFAKARSMGANAFPSVVIIDQEGHMICQKGYKSLEELQKLLKD